MSEITTDTYTKNITHFFELALERQRVYLKKEAGLPKPWTEDTIFQREFFCNVFRTQDTFTKWLQKYVIEPYEHSPDLWARIMVCRYYSRVDAFEDIRLNEGLEDLNAIKRGIWRRKLAGLPYHTQGFLVGFDNPIYRRWCRPFYWLEELELKEAPYRFFHQIKEDNKLETVWKRLMTLPWLGPFIAYEIVTDYSYCKNLLANASDKYLWSSPGPGARRGMRRILFNNPKEMYSDNNWALFSWTVFKDWNTWIKEQRRYTTDYWSSKAIESFYSKLTMREVEHWLCEYDKYMRGGTSKRRYKGV